MTRSARAVGFAGRNLKGRRAQYRALTKDVGWWKTRVRQNAEFNLRARYGITCEDWARKFEEQRGLCAVCSQVLTHDKNTHVDHCHRTGQFRGLLCSCCNQALGNARENIRVLEQLIAYLRSFD